MTATQTLREKCARHIDRAREARLEREKRDQADLEVLLLDKFTRALLVLEIKVLPEACTVRPAWLGGLRVCFVVPNEDVRFEMSGHPGRFDVQSLWTYIRCPYCPIADEWRVYTNLRTTDDLGAAFEQHMRHETSCQDALYQVTSDAETAAKANTAFWDGLE